MLSDEQYQKLLADTRAYLNTQYDLLRLGLLEKLSKIIGLILFALVVILVLFAVMVFGAITLAVVLAQWLPLWASFLIIGGFFLLQRILAVIFRQQWFITPIVAAVSGILFSHDATRSDATGKEVTHAEAVAHTLLKRYRRRKTNLAATC